MKIEYVRMCMLHRLVHVLVGVGLRALVAMVRVLVVFIVDMTVSVHEPPMPVLVRVRFRQHKPGRDHKVRHREAQG